MGKIDDYIAKHKLTPKTIAYHTNRSIKPKGKIRVLAGKDQIARVEYECPKCSHKDYTETEWTRPFAVKCSGCGFRITVPKLKQQIKREQKMENKKKAGK